MKYLILLLMCFNVNAQSTKDLINEFSKKKTPKLDRSLFVVGHSPLGYSSVSVSKVGKNYFANSEVYFLKSKANEYPVLKDLVKKFDADGYLFAGTYYGTDSVYSIYLGFHTKFEKENKGVGLKFKLSQELGSKKLNDQFGQVSAYYYFSFNQVFFRKDFFSFYLGYVTEKSKLQFDNYNKYLDDLKDFNQENLFFGFHYIPNFVNDYALFFEASKKQATFGLSLNLL